MKAALLPFFLLTSLMCFSQEKFTITLGTGIGQYKMQELKSFQHDLEWFANLDGILETIDEFPPYLFYSGEVAMQLKNRFAIGLIYRFQSTGAKSAYSDYSGVLRLEQHLRANNVGILLDFTAWKKSKYALSAQLRAYQSWTTGYFERELFIHGSTDGIETMSGDLKGNSIALNPDVCFSYYVLQNLSVNLTTGYCFDFKGDLEIDAPFSGYSWIQKSDWSGLRIGLSTSYKF